jgi:hypothetical protein
LLSFRCPIKANAKRFASHVELVGQNWTVT